MSTKIQSQTLKKTYYNDIALRLAHKLFGIRHLHYGYFDENLEQSLENLSKAQDEYVRQLVSVIPKNDVKVVFDVGCGTGGVAEVLVKKDYKLTCLAPDPYLIEKTLENTEGRVVTITDFYENVEEPPEEIYDMVLMAESVQYIKVYEGWKQNQRFVRPGGYVLASDFFRVRELDNPHLSKSGHPLDEYIETAREFGFELIVKKEITENVAPTMDIYQTIILDKIFPVAEAIFEIVQRRYPSVYQVLKVILKKSVVKLQEKYTRQDSVTFKKYKGYFMLLFKKTES